MIEIKHLAKTFSNHEIFNDINLKVNTGEILAIIGPSGSGKSTLLRTYFFNVLYINNNFHMIHACC